MRLERQIAHLLLSESSGAILRSCVRDENDTGGTFWKKKSPLRAGKAPRRVSSSPGMELSLARRMPSCVLTWLQGYAGQLISSVSQRQRRRPTPGAATSVSVRGNDGESVATPAFIRVYVCASAPVRVWRRSPSFSLSGDRVSPLLALAAGRGGEGQGGEGGVRRRDASRAYMREGRFTLRRRMTPRAVPSSPNCQRRNELSDGAKGGAIVDRTTSRAVRGTENELPATGSSFRPLLISRVCHPQRRYKGLYPEKKLYECTIMAGY